MAFARRSGLARAGGTDALNERDTIVARSSGAPPAAIAIVRVSGDRAFAATQALIGCLPTARRATLRSLRTAGGEVIDRALVLVFPAAGSATGEDLVELHCHGGRAVVAAVEGALLAIPGLRQAEAGEFTRRALLHGRIDLTQAQGLADLLEAETESQRKLAIRAAEGEVGQALRSWLDRLTAMAAEVEASIDFGEEGDVIAEAASTASVTRDLEALMGDMASVLDAPSVDRWQQGWRIVVAGPPNAGKSTLVNALAQRDAAIVSPIAGTTRDVIEVAVLREGLGYVLVDTAGLRADSVDPIELIGMERAEKAMATADLILWVDRRPCPRPSAVPMIWVEAYVESKGASGSALGSSRAALVGKIWDSIAAQCATVVLPAVPLHRDQRLIVSEAHDLLARAAADDPVLLAETLRATRKAVASLLGIDAHAALTEAIFSRFCIGK